MAVWLCAHSGGTGITEGVAFECRFTAGLARYFEVFCFYKGYRLTMWPQLRDSGFSIHSGYCGPNNKPHCSSLLSVASDETRTKSTWGEGFITPYRLQGREVKVGTEAETTEERFDLACSPGLFSYLF